MSSTRAPRISNSICSPRMTGTSSTTPSPPTWRSPCPPCMTSSAAAALRRRPSPNSRANSRSRSSPRSTTEPTAPGSSSACSRTTSPAASSSIPASSPAVELEAAGEVEENPEEEIEEMSLFYQLQGFTPEESQKMAERLAQQPEQFVQAMAQSELGLSEHRFPNQ